MDIDPIVVEVKPPKTPFKLPFKMPQFGNKSTKIITIVAAVVIILSIVILALFTTLVNNDEYRKKQNIVTATDEIKNAGQVMGAAIPGNTEIAGRGGGSGPDQPKVSLYASAGSVDIGSKVTLRWEVSSNAKKCTASEDWSGEKSLKGTEASPNLTNLTTYTYILTCKNDTSTGYSKVDVSVQQRSGSGVAGQPIVSLGLAKSSIYATQSFSISWSASNSPSSCTASGAWSGTKATSGSEVIGPMNTPGSYKFTLSCANSKGKGEISVTATVDAIPADPVVTVSINPAGPINIGSSATLDWSVLNYSGTCTATGDWSGTKSSKGSQSTGVLSTAKVYNFGLDCGNNRTDSVTISVIEPTPVINSFTASASNVFVGTAPLLSWSSSYTTGANPCTAKQAWSGTKPASGSNVNAGTITSPGTYTYELVCSSGLVTSAAKTIPITATYQPAPVVTLIADSYSVAANGSTNIRWSSTNSPSSCTASGGWSGAKATTGTTTSNVVSTGPLTAGSHTYTLSCSNSNPTAGSASITITASSGGAVTAPVVTISLSPTSILTGTSSTLNWSVANPTGTSCTASGTGGWSGTQGLSGTTSTGVKSTSGSYTYILACTNSAGSDTKTATLSVNSPPTVSISLSATTVSSGASVNLTWSSTNTSGTTPCTATGGWSGTKSASGTTAVTAPAPASPTANSPTGTTTYTVSCSNSYGSASQSVTLTSAYCYQGTATKAVRTPCYGPTTMNAHATAATCWNYWTNTLTNTQNPNILTKVYNIAGFNSAHSGKGSVTLNTTALCGNKALNWSLPNYPSNSKHNSVIQYNNQGTLNGYAVGYYDASSPN